jgi:hypothetical protein
MLRFLGLLGTVLFLSCAPAYTLPNLPRSLRLTPEVLNGMNQIQTEFTLETAFCLLGFIENGVIYVEAMTPALVSVQSSGGVRFSMCRNSTTVGWYHNHPPSPEGDVFCTFTSDADLNTLDKSIQFYVGVMTCTPDTIIYRFKLDDHDNALLLRDYIPVRISGLHPSN